MTLKQVLDTIKSAIPIKAGDYYEELLSDMVNYVEVKTRGFSYEQGILDEPVDWDIYKVKPSELAKTVGKPDPTEEDIVVWLAKELKANDLRIFRFTIFSIDDCGFRIVKRSRVPTECWE